jgi:predicted HAD superfamily Cof-like phosphohydrolase
MSDIFSDQKKFMRACGQTTDQINPAQYKMYVDLVDEEVAELKEAIDTNDRVEQLDALIDILVVTTGALHSLGVNPEGAWKEVMRSNFDKVDSITGRVKKREDGKVLKPEGWEPPRLAKFVRSE